MTRMGLKSLLLLVMFGLGAPARAQTSPDISHDALDCIGVGKYPVVDAAIQPGKEIRTAKVYFRADHYPKFYWVEMVIHEGNFVSILPKPSPRTARIIYYIEAVDVTFNNAVDVEHDPEVREKCEDRPAYLPGEEPGIIVGATEAGASALPPGFETVGIIGTVATTGVVTSGIGGGAGIGTAVAIGAGAAGAGGLRQSGSAQNRCSPTSQILGADRETIELRRSFARQHGTCRSSRPRTLSLPARVASSTGPPHLGATTCRSSCPREGAHGNDAPTVFPPWSRQGKR